MSLRRVIIAGIALWLVPFLISFTIFPFRQAGSPLFETLMTVTLTICGVAGARWTFPKLVPLGQALLTGVVWMAISIMMDVPLFILGPFAMSPSAYAADIGLTYLVFPVIAAGVGAKRPR